MDKGHKPTFNVTDNQATKPIKAFLKTENCYWQFLEPTNHCVNAAERAIQTFKTHFISGLCSTDVEWLFQLWNTMTEQAVITCNILRTSRINPKQSTISYMEGVMIGNAFHWPHRAQEQSCTYIQTIYILVGDTRH